MLLHTHKYTEWIGAPTRALIKREDILRVCVCAHINGAHLTLELPVFKPQAMREESCGGTPLLLKERRGTRGLISLPPPPPLMCQLG